ncbi:MAG TPA: cobalt chelatase [Caldimonas sp.]|nr:cobalt chelatase [Caldimonas sp.]
MSDTQAASRLQERIEELCAATIRALAGEKDLRFRGRRLHRGATRLPLFAPHLHPSLERDDFASFRGAADGLALRLSLSDAALHTAVAPDEPVEQLIFDWLEQFRVESLAPASLPGVAHNLRHRHETWSAAFHDAGHIESARGLLLYTLAQVARARVTGDPVVAATEDRIEATRFALAPLIGHALAGLRRSRRDQAAYATHAKAIATILAAMLRDAGGGRAEGDGANEADADDDDARSVFGLLMEEKEDAANERFATAVSGHGRALGDEVTSYHVFTRTYDREVDAVSLVRPEALGEYRLRLDQRIASQHVRIAGLARALLALFAVPTNDGWDGAQEEGRIDGRTLSLLVAAPAERRLFRREHVEPRADAAVTFLIDCSGSMKVHAEDVALLVDAFARSLEMAGVASEVLGFSTGAWNGGRARRDWLRAGRPAHPGRLNERLHLRFKSFETSWRRARPGIAALFKSEIFREGLDGEAVEWAAGRLVVREERRKILFVVSDGSPMDGATHLGNDARFLDHHLRTVTEAIEKAGTVELHGLGVGLDLSPYYRSSHILDLDARIGNAMFAEVLRLIEKGGTRR